MIFPHIQEIPAREPKSYPYPSQISLSKGWTQSVPSRGGAAKTQMDGYLLEKAPKTLLQLVRKQAQHIDWETQQRKDIHTSQHQGKGQELHKDWEKSFPKKKREPATRYDYRQTLCTNEQNYKSSSREEDVAGC
eukprot:RCo027143